MESILDSIKKLLGIQPEYRVFDEDLIIHINTVFIILNQLHIGPPDGFLLESGDEVWDDYMTKMNEGMIKTYIYLKVRLLFDPPTSSALLESINTMISELEWRLYIEGDEKAIKGGDNDE